MPLSVGNEDVTGLTLVTSKGASLSGNVIAAEGSVAKLNSNQIQITAQAANGQFLPGPLGNRPTRVEADGTFVLTGLSGQTVGKMAAGVRVTTKDGGAIGFGRALGRWLAYQVSILTIAGLALAGWNKRRRGLHDFLSGTVVLDELELVGH